MRNSGDKSFELGLLGSSPAPHDSVSNQAKLVTLHIDASGKSQLEQIIVKPLSCDPYRERKNVSKRSMTSKIPSVNIATMFDQYNKSHCAVDRSARTAVEHYLSSMNFERVKFKYSVHNFPSSEMHQYLTKTVMGR